MTDRISSDHPSITTVRATLARHGATDRPRIAIPSTHAEAFPAGEVVRLVLDERTYHARVDRTFDDDGRQLTGVYDSPTFAREPGSGPNRLVSWVASADLAIGGSVLVDVIEPGYASGLRKPGATVVYDAVEPPKDSLAAIARSIEEDRSG